MSGCVVNPMPYLDVSYATGLTTTGTGQSDQFLDTVIVFRIRQYWEIRKVVNGHSFILIRQMAALVGRALTELYTAPVLLDLVLF